MPWGNSSEAPITVAAGKLGFWKEPSKAESRAKKRQRDRLHPRIMEVPFSSQRKMMMTVHDWTQAEGDKKTMGPGGCELPGDAKYTAIVKGAPNMVLQHCTQWLQADGTFAEFDDEDKE